MSEYKEPDWLGELARGGEALQREAMRIVKAAEELAENGPARPFTRRILRAVGAGIRELAAPGEPVVHNVAVTPHLATASAVVMTPTITAVGSFALPPMRFAGQATVPEPDLIERNIGRIFALVLLAFTTAGLLGVHAQYQASVGFYATVIFGALSLAFAIWAGRK